MYIPKEKFKNIEKKVTKGFSFQKKPDDQRNNKGIIRINL